MTAPRNKSNPRGIKRTGAIVWVVLASLVFAAGVVAITFGKRFRRVELATNQVRSAVQEAERRQQAVLKAQPVRKEFSAAFLQMAFGDNPPLLEEIKKALGQALGERPGLSQGEAAMMLVTYRAEGELRDVAIHIFGNMVPEYLPQFSTDGYWRSQLNDQFYHVGQSLLSVLGRQLVVLANRNVEESQRGLMEALIHNRYSQIHDYLHDPVSFIAIIPEPGNVFSDEFRPYVAAVLLKGKVSTDEMRVEMIALSFDSDKALNLAQLLSDIRLTAIGLARLRFGGSEQAEGGLEALMQMNIRAEGPTVVAQTVLSGETIERGLPKAVQALSKGMGRIRRGPGYPS